MPAPDPKPEAASFRQELVRQRKGKAEKTKPREAAERTNAAEKPQRGHKARKTRVKGGKPEADPAEATPRADRDSHELLPQQEATPAHEVEDGGVTAPSDNVEEKHSAEAVGTDRTDAAAVAGAAAAPRAAVPSDVAPPAGVGEAPPKPQGVSALSASAVGAEAVSDQGAAAGSTNEGPVDPQSVATDEATAAEGAPAADTEPRPAASAAAKSQPAAGMFGQALVGASGPSAEEGGEQSGDQGAGESPSTDAAWMQEFDAAGAFSEATSTDDSADAPHAARAGTADAIQSLAGDLSAMPAAPAGVHGASAGRPTDAMPPEARFAAANHENIVKGMHAEVMPNGGTMRIRLDPPQLGALQVTVHVRDGVVTAAFETSNDEATRLLGHSLNQLKAVLESHGVGVDKLQVQQAPREEHANASRDDGSSSRHQGQTPYEQEQAARQEQQRKEMLRKMWRRLSGFSDPLDVTV